MYILTFIQGDNEDNWKVVLPVSDNLLTAAVGMDSIAQMLKKGYWLRLDGDDRPIAKIDNGQRYLFTQDGYKAVEFETFMEYATNDE